MTTFKSRNPRVLTAPRSSQSLDNSWATSIRWIPTGHQTCPLATWRAHLHRSPEPIMAHQFSKDSRLRRLIVPWQQRRRSFRACQTRRSTPKLSAPLAFASFCSSSVSWTYSRSSHLRENSCAFSPWPWSQLLLVSPFGTGHNSTWTKCLRRWTS